MQPIQGTIENITEAEVKTKLDKMAANKARRPDDLPVEVIKLLKDTGTKWITVRKSKITPIYKQKENPFDSGNYRGIKLLSHSLKLWERAIEARLRKIVKIIENQYGLQNRKSTTKPMFCIRLLLEKYREFGRKLYMVLVDLEKAYNTNSRDQI